MESARSLRLGRTLVLPRRHDGTAAALVLALWSGAGLCAGGMDCSEPPADGMARYERIHDVTIRGMVRGPDAIELEVHKDIPARDELALWPAGADAMCVAAIVYDRNGRDCRPVGTAAKNDAGEFVLREQGCAVAFSVRPDQVDMRVSGDGCVKAFCLGNGEFSDAIFTPR